MDDKQEENKKGTFIHGIGASEHVDSSGERIKVEGIDISSLTKDGVFNFEHQSKEASAIVGKITQAKKILKEEDCENEAHKYFWNKIKMPFLYVAGELFDADGHQAAQDIAAMLKYDVRNKDNKETKKLINFSIEGSKLDKKGSEILKSIARKVSITITPCNKVCEAEILNPDDIENGSSINKFGEHENNFSMVQDLMSKSEGHFASVETMEKDNWGEMGIGATIKNEKKKKKNKKESDVEDLNKFEFFNRLGNRFNQFKQRRAMDRTAKRVMRERKRGGQAFDPEQTVRANKDKTMTGSGAMPNKNAVSAPKSVSNFKPLVQPKMESDPSPAQQKFSRDAVDASMAGRNKMSSFKPVDPKTTEMDTVSITKSEDEQGHQYNVVFKDHVPVHKKSRGFDQYHLSKEQIKHILANWDETTEWQKANKFGRKIKEGDFHPTAISRSSKSAPVPIREYLKHSDRHDSGLDLLYHGVGRDEAGANALSNEGSHNMDKYDPFHPEKNYRELPNKEYDEVHSHYTLNVVPEHVGKNIIKEIHDRMKPGGKAVISVRRDLKMPEKMEKSESGGYKPKRGDIVHTSGGAVEWKDGKAHPIIDRSKKYVVHGESKKGFRRSHWIVPEGEKDSKKGKYHRSDRLHPADSGDMDKAMGAGSGMAAPATAVQGEALMKKSEKESIFENFAKKEELFDLIIEKYPDASEQELFALAKSVVVLHVKKQELALEEMMKSKNVRAQKKKLFGSNSMPSGKRKGQHMDVIDAFSRKFFNLALNPSGGKIDKKTGERRVNKGPGVDKPDWRSGQLETQWNPDAAVHELAHLLLIPKGYGLEDAQALMDKQFSDTQKKYGYAKQFRSEYEVQPRGVEQIIRRMMGLPASTNSVTVKEDTPPRTALEDEDRVVGKRIQTRKFQDGSPKYEDLLRQTRNLTPEVRKVLYRRLSGMEVFDHKRGWVDTETPDAKVNERAMDQELGDLDAKYEQDQKEMATPMKPKVKK